MHCQINCGFGQQQSIHINRQYTSILFSVVDVIVVVEYFFFFFFFVFGILFRTHECVFSCMRHCNCLDRICCDSINNKTKQKITQSKNFKDKFRLFASWSGRKCFLYLFVCLSWNSLLCEAKKKNQIKFKKRRRMKKRDNNKNGAENLLKVSVK